MSHGFHDVYLRWYDQILFHDFFSDLNTISKDQGVSSINSWSDWNEVWPDHYRRVNTFRSNSSHHFRINGWTYCKLFSCGSDMWFNIKLKLPSNQRTLVSFDRYVDACCARLKSFDYDIVCSNLCYTRPNPISLPVANVWIWPISNPEWISWKPRVRSVILARLHLKRNKKCSEIMTDRPTYHPTNQQTNRLTDGQTGS